MAGSPVDLPKGDPLSRRDCGIERDGTRDEGQLQIALPVGSGRRHQNATRYKSQAGGMAAQSTAVRHGSFRGGLMLHAFRRNAALQQGSATKVDFPCLMLENPCTADSPARACADFRADMVKSYNQHRPRTGCALNQPRIYCPRPFTGVRYGESGWLSSRPAQRSLQSRHLLLPTRLFSLRLFLESL